MATYEAGKIFLAVVPSFQGVQQKIDREAAKWGLRAGTIFGGAFKGAVEGSPQPTLGPSDADAAKQGEDAGKAYRTGFRSGLGSGAPLPVPGPGKAASGKQGSESGGAYADAFRRKLEAATRAIPPVRLGVASSQAEQTLREIRRDMEALRDKTIGVDISGEDAIAEAKRIEAVVETALRDQVLTVQARTDLATALAGIKAVREEAERPTVLRVDADVNEGSFVTKARAAVKRAQEALPRLELDADSTPAQVEVARIRASLQTLGDKTVGVDLTAAEFLAETQRLNERLEVVTRDRSVDIRLRSDAAATIAALAAANAEVDRLNGRTARVDVDSSSINTFSGRLVLLGTVIGTLLPALVPIGGAALVGLGGIGAAASAAIPAVGALVLGLNGVGEALKQMSAVDEESAGVAAKGAAARESQAQAQANAARAIESAEASLANTRANAARAAEDASQRIADAQQRVVAAEAASAKGAEDSARKIADAQQAVLDARIEAARAAEQSARRIADAERSLQDAQDRAAKAAEDSADRVAKAKDNAAKSQDRAVKQVVQALRRQEDAEKSLANAQESAVEAQEALTRARADAQDQLEDLSFRVQKGALDQRQAVLDVADAQKELDDTIADPGATDDAREQAQIRFAEAKLQLEQLQVENQRLAEQKADADAKGVEGSDTVVAAQDRIQTAVERRAEAERAASEAAAAVEEQRAELRQQAADDYEAITDAQQAQAESALSSARSVADAEQGLVDARDAAALQAEQSTRRVADAERAVGDAVAASNEARIQAADRLVEAQEAVGDAVEAQAEQQRSAAFSVEQAERSVIGAREAAAAAAVAGGIAATAAMTNLQTAMANLSPVQRDFAEFLYGMRDEVGRLQDASAEGMLPGFQRAIETLLPLMPLFEDILRNVGTSVGVLAEKIADGLASDAFRPFLEFLRDEGGPLLEQFGDLIGNLATALLPGLVAAFGPIAGPVLQVLQDLTQRFADFLLTAQDNDAFQRFMDYVVTNSPAVAEFLGSLSDAFVNIIESMAPFGVTILGVIGGLLDFIAAIPPGVLQFIATAVLGIAGAFAFLGPVINFVLGIVGAISAGMPIMGAVIAALGGPVTLIIAGIIALGAALLAAWHHSETFRNVVYAIGDALAWAWGKVSDFGKALVDGFLLIFNNPGILWDAIKFAFQFLVDQVRAFLGINSPSTVFAEIGGWVIAGLQGAIEVGIAAIQLIFRGLVTFWEEVLAPAAAFLWRNVMQPAFDGIALVVKAAWAVVEVALKAFVYFMEKVIAPAATWLWRNILQPAFEGISTAVKWAWENVIQPALKALVWYWENVLSPALNWLWKEIFEPAFKAIGKIVEVAWAVIRIALDALIFYWNTVLGPAVSFLWNNVFGPAFQGIGNAVKWAWENVIEPALKALKKFFDETLGPAIETGVSAFTTAWDKMKEAARTPINFVIREIYTGGIKKLFDKIAEAVGSDVRLPVISEIGAGGSGMARGGVLPGSSSWRDGDDQMVAMRRGEGVYVSEAMRDPYERRRLFAANSAAMRGESMGSFRARFDGIGFAKGGIVDLGRWFQGKGARVAEHPAFGGVAPVHKGRGHYEGRAIDVNYGPGGESATEKSFFDQYAAALKKAGWTVYWRVPGHFNHLHAEAPNKSFEGSFPDGSALSAIGDFLGGAFDAVKGIIGDLNPLDALRNKASDLFTGIGAGGPLVDIAKATINKATGLMGDKLTGLLSAINPFDSESENDTPAVLGSSAAANREIVRQKAAGRGWNTGSQWSALEWLVNKESSFRNTAQNPTSTAYGLFQFLNGTWAGVGGKKTSDPALQTEYGLRYIAQRYGNPVAAKAWHQKNNWYWPGGIIGQPTPANLSPIPAMALGGVVKARTGGTVVRLGEAGRDEAVVDAGLLNRRLLDIERRQIDEDRKRKEAAAKDSAKEKAARAQTAADRDAILSQLDRQLAAVAQEAVAANAAAVARYEQKMAAVQAENAVARVESTAVIERSQRETTQAVVAGQAATTQVVAQGQAVNTQTQKVGFAQILQSITTLTSVVRDESAAVRDALRASQLASYSAAVASAGPGASVSGQQLAEVQRVSADRARTLARAGLTVNAYGAREDVLAANVLERLRQREALDL